MCQSQNRFCQSNRQTPSNLDKRQDVPGASGPGDLGLEAPNRASSSTRRSLWEIRRSVVLAGFTYLGCVASAVLSSTIIAAQIFIFLAPKGHVPRHPRPRAYHHVLVTHHRASSRQLLLKGLYRAPHRCNRCQLELPRFDLRNLLFEFSVTPR